MKIHELPGDPGRRQKRKRVGRGEASGHGKTSGRGSKGQKARSGGKRDSRARRFEGGQMPLIRRIPKKGFTNPNRIDYQIVNVGQLGVFAEGTTVDRDALKAAGLIAQGSKPVKLLSEGELTVKLTVIVDRASKTAAEAVTKAGGSIEAVVGKPSATNAPRKKSPEAAAAPEA